MNVQVGRYFAHNIILWVIYIAKENNNISNLYSKNQLNKRSKVTNMTGLERKSMEARIADN